MLIDLASVGWLVVWSRPLRRRMCGIRDDVWREVYPEVEIDDDLGVCLGLGVVTSMPMAVVIVPMVVGVYEAGSGFFVGSAYVEMVRRRGS